MAGAELEIRFTGDDPEQKAAFEQPEKTLASTQRPSVPTATAPTTAGRDDASNIGRTEAGASTSEDKLILSIDDLIAKLTELIDSSVKEQRSSSPSKANESPQHSLDGFLGKFEGQINKFLEFTGLQNTRGGQFVGNLARSTIGKVSQVGKTVASIGRAAAVRAGVASAAPVAGTGAAAAAAGLSAALGPVGIAAAGTAAALGAAGYTVKTFSDALHEVSKELTQLSPALALEAAQADANRQLARLNRAGRIGTDLASLEASRNKLSEATYEVQTKILEALLQYAPAINAVVDSATKVVDFSGKLVENATGSESRLALTILGVLDTSGVTGIFANILNTLELTRLDGKSKAEKEAMNQKMDIFLEQFLKLHAPGFDANGQINAANPKPPQNGLF